MQRLTNPARTSSKVAMSHPAQMSHIRSGFAIINDPPVRGPYDDLPYILDGHARLAAMKAHDEQIKRVADENAKIDAELAEAKAALARWSAER
jgi:hypothetical protein